MNPELVSTKKLNSDTIFSFINEAIDKFYKTRYSGLNTKQEGFELSQKRVDDLRSLVKTITYTTDIENTNNTFKVTLPDDYVHLLGDKVGISPLDDSFNDCWEIDDEGNYVVKYADTIESSIETIDRQLNNSLSEHILKYSNARPLKLIQGNNILLYTDGNYKVSEYNITYLSKPTYFDSKNITNTEYTALPEHTHMEIVKLAVQIYLATKPMEHYSAYSTEVNNME